MVLVAMIAFDAAGYAQDAAEGLAGPDAVVSRLVDPGATTATKSGYHAVTVTQFGGPNSVGAQLKKDDKLQGPLIPLDATRGVLKPYFDFKANLREKTGLSYGLDYNALVQGATESLGEDLAGDPELKKLQAFELTNRLKWFTPAEILKHATVNNAELYHQSFCCT